MFAVPIAQVSLIDADRQWIKSSAGWPPLHSPRAVSFCSHAILGADVFHVSDAQADARFADNPLVTGDPRIRFYAGCPLRVEGHNLGALCLIDRQPRAFTEEERNLLVDLARMVEEELAAEHRAASDELTGLANRRGFESFARHVLGISKRVAMPLTLVYFDLDEFKSINDRFGHGEGDRALKIFARVLSTTIRESDFAARLGGDEFVVLLTNSAAATAHRVIAALHEVLQEAGRHAEIPYPIRCSAGVVEFDGARHAVADDLLREADAAMYRNKITQRTMPGSSVFPTPML